MENPIVVPEINLEDCTGCADCVPACPSEAISVLENKVAVAPDEECAICAVREDVCPTGAIAWPYEVVFAGDYPALGEGRIPSPSGRAKEWERG